MTAKEMFEKLGYECNYIKNDNSEDTITYHKDNLHIQFNLIGKQVVVQNDSSYVFYGHAVFFINQELLQAINKQVEELGWEVNK